MKATGRLLIPHQNSVQVTLGLQTANEFEIKSGVYENELVVFGNPTQYKTGESAEPKEIEPPMPKELP